MKLGFETEDLEVNMRRDADFSQVIRRRTSAEDATPIDWDDGTVIELRFGDADDPTVWTASISGAEASFSEDSDAVNTLLDSDQRVARLFYVLGDIEVCWAVGAIITRTQP